MVQKAKTHVPTLTSKAVVTPVANRTNSAAATYNAPKINNKIEPVKEYFSPKEPQKVQLVGQNVSNRLLAHEIAGGLGMGISMNRLEVRISFTQL